MNKQLVKVCALCDHTIPYHQIVCFNHKADLEQYEDELWFQELVAAQQKQYEIDMTEQRGDTFRLQIEQKQSKTRGKQLSYSTKSTILKMYASGLGDRRIAKQLNLSYKTVNTFLWRHRKKRAKNSSCSANAL